MATSTNIWEKCVDSLQQELPSQQFNTWIRPLTVDPVAPVSEFRLLAPNRFILDWVNDRFLHRIKELVSQYLLDEGHEHLLDVTVSTVTGQQTGFQSYRQTSRAVEPPINNRVDPAPADYSHNLSMTDVPRVPISPSVADMPLAVEGLERKPEPPVVAQPYSNDANPAMLRESYGQRSGAHRADIRPTTEAPQVQVDGALKHKTSLNKLFTFKTFVEGKSNQMGLAAAQQIAENPGGAYNPLFIYGGVGLGKTHLMHAVGNEMVKRNANAKIVYLHSERFVADMVKALQLNAINDFKRYYRSVDALLIDDIQFFAGKDRSQEEFFHTFNALLEGNQQIILTCDRYPKVINNLEERLKSRFGWGLTVEVEPPELETRAAILMKKAAEVDIPLPHDAAFFIAQKIRSNVRELEGALKRVIANSQFTNRPISIDLIKEALKDLLALQDKQVSITNIQRVVGEYYKVKVGDFLSKRRSRSVARPRQVAMSLAKELTNHSLPEIGDAFGGRDHTTVLHACRKIKELSDSDTDIQQDLKNLQRLLTS